MSTVLSKQPSENILYDFDLTDWLRDSSETISSVISIVDDQTALTYGTPAISGQIVQVTVAGGTTGVVYKITVKVVTSVSPIVEADFYLSVLER